MRLVSLLYAHSKEARRAPFGFSNLSYPLISYPLELRGCSSNGRAPALHAGGTGIDTLLLHLFLLWASVQHAFLWVSSRRSVAPFLPLGLIEWGVSSVVEQLVAAR
jgi:hypothetical protein